MKRKGFVIGVWVCFLLVIVLILAGCGTLIGGAIGAGIGGAVGGGRGAAVGAAIGAGVGFLFDVASLDQVSRQSVETRTEVRYVHGGYTYYAAAPVWNTVTRCYDVAVTVWRDSDGHVVRQEIRQECVVYQQAPVVIVPAPPVFIVPAPGYDYPHHYHRGHGRHDRRRDRHHR